MKTIHFILITFIWAVIFITGVSFAGKQTTDKSTATVDRSDGLFIFVMCRPAAPYDVLGTVTKKVAWTGAPSEMLQDQVKKVKKEHPTAEGIIFNLEMDRAEAIKFK